MCFPATLTIFLQPVTADNPKTNEALMENAADSDKKDLGILFDCCKSVSCRSWLVIISSNCSVVCPVLIVTCYHVCDTVILLRCFY